MKIILHAKNLDLTPAIRSFVQEKVGQIEKFLSPADRALAEARVEVSRPSRHHHKGFVYYAEINLKIGSQLSRATAEHLDLHTAIDRARDEIELQIKKQKQKNIDSRRLAKRP